MAHQICAEGKGDPAVVIIAPDCVPHHESNVGDLREEVNSMPISSCSGHDDLPVAHREAAE